MTFCAVAGCNSTSNDSSTNYTFHLVPSSLILRTQWILALGPLPDDSYVCSRHFDESMFTNHQNKKILNRIAVPKLFGLDIPQKELPRDMREFSDEAEETSGGGSSDELIACRACLAADGRLYAISGSGLEDALVTLTGIAMPVSGLPRHLCAFCAAKLSKCVAFRDSCQRSTALLQTLLEKGPLKMNDVKTINRNSHKLTNNLTCYKVFEFGTDKLVTVQPEIKTENDEISHEVTAFVDVECKGKKNSIKNDVDVSFEVPIEKHEITEVKSVKLKTENLNANSENDYTDSEMKNDTDGDTDSSEETLAAVKKGKRKRLKVEKENTAKYSKKKCKNVKSKLSKVDVAPTNKTEAAPKKTRSLRKKIGVKTETESAFEKNYNCKTKLLSKEEQKQEVEERIRNNRSAFSCDLCGKGFKKQNTLMTHKSYHDPSLPAECDVCRLRFRSRRSLLKHQDCHRAIFTCNECGIVSRNRSHAKDHCLMHKGTTYTCPYCHIIYNHQTSYYNHIRVQHPGQNEACDECGETFAAGRGMMLHKALTHKQHMKPNVDLKCKDCDVKFSNGEALRRHLELSAGVPHAALWPCAACGDSCGSETALAAHAAERHPPEQRYCQECNKTFSNAASFALHVDRKHKNQRAVEAPFRPRPGIGRVRSTVCEICGKVYQNLTMLQYHMNGHLSVKPFQCPHCPKAFTHQSNHRLHMRVHTGERPYQCEQCPLAFSRRGNFTKHMKNVHLRVQVKCDTCGKMVGAGSLASHVRAVHLRQPYVRRKRDRTADKKLLLGAPS